MTKKAVTKEVAVKEGINAPIKLNVTDATLGKLEKKFAKVPDVSKKEGYEFVRVGLGELRTLRTGIGKYKGELKAEAIAYNKRVDTEYNRVIDVITAMEEPMKVAKDAEDAKKEALKEEKRKKEEDRKFKINQKINEIREIAFSFTDETSEAIREQVDAVKEIQITKDIYEEFVTAAQMAVIDVKTRLEALLENVVKREEADAERKIEDERLAKERQEFDDKKAADDKETERLKSIGALLDAIKDLPFKYQDSSSSDLEIAISSLEIMPVKEDEFAEFCEDAETFKAESLKRLGSIKKQAEDKETLQEKQEELDEREKKANENRETAAEEVRLAEEKEAQAKKDKKAEKENKALQEKREQETIVAIASQIDVRADKAKTEAVKIVKAIQADIIPYVTFG